MKKFLLTIAMLSSVVAMAQDKPLNPGFENWEGILAPKPTNYATTADVLEAFIGVPIEGDWVTRSTQKSEGTFSVKLMTDSASIPGFGTFNVPGFIFSYDTDEFDFNSLGFPFTDAAKRPVKLKGNYKCDIKGTDTVSVQMIASYFDEDAQERIVIGFGDFIQTVSKANFEPLNINVDYEFELLPDTITIIGSTGSFGGDTAVVGTALWLDNFSYELAEIGDTTDTSTSIRNTILASASVYPNPTVDVVNVKMNETVSPNAVVTVFDAIGRKTYNRSYTVSNNEIRFNVADLMNGYYIINIVDNGKMYTKSFLKK